MTIVTRRRVYWVLFVAAALNFGIALILAFPIYSGEAGPAFLRVSGAVRDLKLFGAALESPGFAATGALVAALYAALVLGFVLASFRKTVSSEVFFFAFWALSVGAEGGRLLLYRLGAAGASSEWILLAARFVLAGRYMGYLAIFTSGLYAAGFRNEKLGSVAIIIVGLGIAIAASLPLNTWVYEPNLMIRPGYALLGSMMAVVAGAVTVGNFLYAAISTGEAAYRHVALGTALALLGQALLINSWKPWGLLCGMALLGFGSWLFVSRLHAYYLWQ